MILMLGGTSETAPIAVELAQEGYHVLVSQATDTPLDIGDHPHISRRTGPMDAAEMQDVIARSAIRAIVDATHPYAVVATTTARQVAQEANIPFFCYMRPGCVNDADVLQAANHEEAAALAFAEGCHVLLTTGSRNLKPYVRESLRTGLRLAVRVLDHPHSIDACLEAGINRESIIAQRGPYTVEDNRSAIREFGAGVLVTKDSGSAGGVETKLEAARLESCKVVVVQRPPACEMASATVAELISRVVQTIPKIAQSP